MAVRECPDDKEADNEIQVFTFSYDEIQEACRDFLVAAADGEQAEKGYTFADFEIKAYDSAGYVSQLRIGDTSVREISSGMLWASRPALFLSVSAGKEKSRE